VENVTAAETIDYVDAEDRVVRRGPRHGAQAAGLHYRVAATIVHTGDAKVLVYRRSPRAEVFPGHHDVLIGGGVRAGETYREAALRELAEEFGLRPHLHEAYRVSHDSPIGPCHLVVHIGLLDAVPKPDPIEIDGHELLPLARVLADPPQPFIPAGLEALNRCPRLIP
jgi:8-oxo-dGTP pyrophosphatase MutT (NUDIX family)